MNEPALERDSLLEARDLAHAGGDGRTALGDAREGRNRIDRRVRGAGVDDGGPGVDE